MKPHVRLDNININMNVFVLTAAFLRARESASQLQPQRRLSAVAHLPAGRPSSQLHRRLF
jgi:hypothetical protein